MADTESYPGREAIRQRGWLRAHQWLLLRRISQLAVLGLFMIGPWFGIWVIEGNLASSLIADTVPLTDPLVLLQQLVAGQMPVVTGFIGAGIVLLFYIVVGGRTYCSWVCPINAVTDAADWLRARLGFKSAGTLSRSVRYWLLAGILAATAASGMLAWELINPVSMVFRGLVFGMGGAWGMVLAIFVLDLFVSRRAWCGHLCPVGAFYGLVGDLSLLRIGALAREKCDDCMDCFAICPEPQVIKPALKGAPKGIGPVILSGNCTNCGRCIDVCARDVFSFTTRIHNQNARWGTAKREVMP